jgi:phosphoribosylpyrophosphate synthetase
MVAPAKQSKHRERSQWTARDIGYVLATLALARVVTRDLVASQNKNFGRNPSWSYVKPVVTRGSTVCTAVSLYNVRVRATCFRMITTPT